MKLKLNLILIVLSLLLSCSSQKEAPLLYLPDDLEATLWAESPMFYNPTNIDVDARGRIWVTEAVNYRNFNNDSTKNLFHQPGDRVMILKDTDDDGVAESSKIFVQDKDLISPLGIAIIGNKIYVSCSPHLLVYTDANGDDKPDSKEIFLTGFGGYDHDHSLHSLTAGPDGNFYFNTGNAGPHTVQDKSGWTLRSGSIYTGGSPYNLENSGNRKSDDGRVWVGGLALRVKPDGSGLKVLAHNFRNSYEVVTDSHGNLWQNDNDDQVVTCRTTWVMEGGNAGYFSTDGTRYWQADQRPGQDAFTAHWHQEDPGVMPAGDQTGAGSPTGVVVYEGDALGEKYRGMLLSADAGRNVVFGYWPKVKQSGFDLGERTSFITSLARDTAGYVWNDSMHVSNQEKWFRPSDVTVGTEGAIYVADWFDPIVGGHQMKDSIGYGRIYRIAPKGKELRKPLIDLSTVSGQIEALKNPAINVRYSGFNKLKAQGEAVLNDVKELLSDANPFIQSRAIFLMAQLGKQGQEAVKELLSDKNEQVRITAVRALRQTNTDLLELASSLVQDKSAFVRRELAIALRDYPFDKTKPTILELAKTCEPSDKWMLETLGSLCEGHEAEMFNGFRKTLAMEGKPSTEWSNAFTALAWRLHPTKSVNDFQERALAPSLNAKQKDAALTALAFINTKESANAMLALSKNSDKIISERAMYWLSFRQSNDWFKLMDWAKTGVDVERERIVTKMKVKESRVMDELQSFDERRWNAIDMAKDKIGGQMLIARMANGGLPKEVLPTVEEWIFKNPDLSVRLQASSYFKKPGSATMLDISQLATLKGDAINGQQLFEKNCSTCHVVRGKGLSVGPELTDIKKKFDKPALLDAIVNPSAGIVFGYEACLIQLKNGDSRFGFLIADGAENITLKDITGKTETIAIAQIQLRKKQEKSLMPEPDALGLDARQLADVVAYLQAL